MNITNPKVQIFFLAFFPQFVTEFPAFLPGLEPREECGLSKFFNLGPNAAKHAHSFRLRYIQPL